MGYLEGQLEKLADQIDQANKRREFIQMHELTLEYQKIYARLSERKKNENKKKTPKP